MFQCDQCNKTCSNKSNLIRHLQLHQRDTFDCECGDNFNTKQALLEHKKKHQDDRPYNCTENGCTKTFASVSGLWSHKRRVHRMSIEDGKNKCEVCDKIFGQKGHLQDHMLTHYDVKEFQCDLCKKKFKYQRNVARHKKKCLKKRETTVVTYKCSICPNAIFKRKRYLEEHKKAKHSKETSFQCQKCGAIFRWRSSLSRHTSKSRCHENVLIS